MEGVGKIYDLRQKKNEEICLSDCLQLADKKNIFMKSEALFSLTTFNSKAKWETFMSDVEGLRNNLAHANDLGTESWTKISILTIDIERVLRDLEKEGFK